MGVAKTVSNRQSRTTAGDEVILQEFARAKDSSQEAVSMAA
jgi:hypothetical protein